MMYTIWFKSLFFIIFLTFNNIIINSIFSQINYFVEKVIKTGMMLVAEMMEMMKKNIQEAMEQLRFL